jgi:hypothetical protein
MNSIKRGEGYNQMIANDVLQEIIAMKISEKNVDDALPVLVVSVLQI